MAGSEDLKILDISRETTSVLAEVGWERRLQDRKWGPQNHPQMTWLGILAEEFGEAAKEANELHFRPGVEKEPPIVFGGPQHPDYGKPLIKDQIERLRSELMQVAAVAVAAIESLDRNGK